MSQDISRDRHRNINEQNDRGSDHGAWTGGLPLSGFASFLRASSV